MRLSLNRPEKRNALNAELCRELADALEQADRDPRVGAILLTAHGPSFCAGMDLAEMALTETDDTAVINVLHERLFTIGARLAKPLVGAVRGAALGGGMGLVANCHIVVAAESATFGFTEIRLGLWPFLVYRAATAALGERRTLELSLTGRILGAAEARDIGLVHEVVSDPDLRAREVAESVAAFNPSAIQKGLQFVQEARGKDWEIAGRIARKFRDQVFASPDFQAALRAFREKKKPG